MIDKNVALSYYGSIRKNEKHKQTIKIGETNYVKNYWY